MTDWQRFNRWIWYRCIADMMCYVCGIAYLSLGTLIGLWGPRYWLIGLCAPVVLVHGTARYLRQLWSGHHG